MCIHTCTYLHRKRAIPKLCKDVQIHNTCENKSNGTEPRACLRTNSPESLEALFGWIRVVALKTHLVLLPLQVSLSNCKSLNKFRRHVTKWTFCRHKNMHSSSHQVLKSGIVPSWVPCILGPSGPCHQHAAPRGFAEVQKLVPISATFLQRG